MKTTALFLLTLLTLTACMPPVFVKELEPATYQLQIKGNDFTSVRDTERALTDKAAALCTNGNYDEVKPVSVEEVETTSYANGMLVKNKDKRYTIVVRCKQNPL